MMVLAGDVFDVPIRKDIVQRVVRWQLAKRQQVSYDSQAWRFVACLILCIFNFVVCYLW